MAMYVIYVAVTIVAALANGYAASLDFIGAQSVKMVADRVHVPRSWMIPLGSLLASGAAGLLIDLAVPVLAVAALIATLGYHDHWG